MRPILRVHTLIQIRDFGVDAQQVRNGARVAPAKTAFRGDREPFGVFLRHRQSLLRARNPGDFVSSLTGRVQALANAHDLLTQTIVLFQDTSLVYVISATDLLGAATKIAQRDGRLVEMYLTVGVIYFVLCYAASQFVKQLQGRLAYGTR